MSEGIEPVQNSSGGQPFLRVMPPTFLCEVPRFHHIWRNAFWNSGARSPEYLMRHLPRPSEFFEGDLSRDNLQYTNKTQRGNYPTR